MTTLPTYLPALMRGALEAGAEISVLRNQLTKAPQLELRIIWSDGSMTTHVWEYVPISWDHRGPGRLADTRARIRREAQR